MTFASLADYVAHQARAADLIITGPDIGGSVFDHTRQVGIAVLVMTAGCPVLIVPKGRGESYCSKSSSDGKERANPVAQSRTPFRF